MLIFRNLKFDETQKNKKEKLMREIIAVISNLLEHEMKSIKNLNFQISTKYNISSSSENDDKRMTTATRQPTKVLQRQKFPLPLSART